MQRGTYICKVNTEPPQPMESAPKQRLRAYFNRDIGAKYVTYSSQFITWYQFFTV